MYSDGFAGIRQRPQHNDKIYYYYYEVNLWVRAGGTEPRDRPTTCFFEDLRGKLKPNRRRGNGFRSPQIDCCHWPGTGSNSRTCAPRGNVRTMAVVLRLHINVFVYRAQEARAVRVSLTSWPGQLLPLTCYRSTRSARRKRSGCRSDAVGRLCSVGGRETTMSGKHLVTRRFVAFFPGRTAVS